MYAPNLDNDDRNKELSIFEKYFGNNVSRYLLNR